MRKLLPHILSTTLVILFFMLCGADVFAQTQNSPTIVSPTTANTSVNPLPSFSIGGWLKEASNQTLAWIALGILSLFAWLVGITGVLLNFAISHLVIGMGELVLRGGYGVTIETMWGVIRDLVNLSFIFALIYVGISTILQISAFKVDTKKALASIIISMLLVNFSLYFAKVIIDVSNLIAFSVYQQMTTAPGSQVGYINNVQIGITGVFADRIGVSSLLVTGGGGGVREQILQNVSKDGGAAFLIVFALGSSIFLFKLAIAFAFGAFILIVRFVTLILLMIFAPVAFLPSEIPMASSISSRWWKTLLTQSFVAPVYIFGLYVTLLILTSAPWNTQNGLATLFMADSPTGLETGLRALLFFVIALVMLFAATAAAKSLSASGAEVSRGLAKVVGKGLSGAAMAGRFAGRNTLGRAGARFAESEGLNRAAARKGFGGFLARRTLKSAGSAAKSNWDLRGTKAFGTTLNSFNETAGVKVDAGKPSKDSYKSLKDKRQKDEYAFAKSLGQEDVNDPDNPVMAKANETRAKITGIENRLKSESLTEGERQELIVEKGVLEKRHSKEVAEAKVSRQTNYAAKIEGEGVLSRFIFGRTKAENKKVGNHIRTQIVKDANKTEMEKLMDVVKENAPKKDD